MTTQTQTPVDDAIATIQHWIAMGKPHRRNINCPPVHTALRAAKLSAGRRIFWRGTNRKAEIADMRRGVVLVSHNHRDDMPERGLSVCESPSLVAVYGYTWAYQVSGDIVGTGSDQEILLTNCTAIGPIRPIAQWKTCDTDAATTAAEQTIYATIAAATGLSDTELFFIESERY